MSLRVRVRACYAPKRGNSSQEFEDAFWPRRRSLRQSSVFRCAVADGATEASFSAEWAQMLARTYSAGHMSNGGLAPSLCALQAEWIDLVGSRPLPWYAQEKVRQGAFSSLVGLTITPGAYDAMAVGDSCMFRVRHDRMVSAFPLDSSNQFGNTPYLLSSSPRRNGDMESHVRRLRASCGPGDRFLLMTDALACWFLHRVEQGDMPWRELSQLRNGGSSFGRWLEQLRSCGAIRNDDTTLLSVEIV